MKIKAFLFLLIISFQALSADVRVYDFKNLYTVLGYPSADYFGSTEEEIQDLETYTSKEDTFYQEINSFLRFFPEPYDWNGIGPQEAVKMVGRIDQIFEKAPSLPVNLMLFRGLSLHFRNNNSFSIGEEFVEKGYLSTSTSFDIAHYFAIEKYSSMSTGEKRVIFAFYVNAPKIKGILIDEGEDEVLLKHGLRIRVMANRKGNLYDFYLAQICIQTCEEKVALKTMDYWRDLGDQNSLSRPNKLK